MAEQNSRKRARVDGTPPPAGLYPDHQGRPSIPNDASSELLGPPPAYSPAPDYRSTAPSTPLVRPFHRTEPSQASAAGSPTGLKIMDTRIQSKHIHGDRQKILLLRIIGRDHPIRMHKYLGGLDLTKVL
ncbi:unnamed protein product [Alternaria alternata]